MPRPTDAPSAKRAVWPTNPARFLAQHPLWLAPLLLVEILAVTLAMSADFIPDATLRTLIISVRDAFLVVLMTVPYFVLLTWFDLPAIAHQRRKTITTRHVARALGANLVLFTGTVGASAYLTASAGKAPIWAIYGYFLLLAGAGLTLAVAFAPPRFWIGLAWKYRLELTLALFFAVLTVAGARMTTMAWAPLAAATMYTSYALLLLLGRPVMVEPATRIMGLDGFKVEIAGVCSGIEGIGLVLVFVSVFLIAFRKQLRFPNALFLLPLGVVAIWFMNAIRIAVLIAIGAYISPTVAVEGFHSQGGWIAFLGVATLLITLAYRSPFFRKDAAITDAAAAADPAPAVNPRAHLAIALLAPFVALLLAKLIAAAIRPYDLAAYPLVVAFVVPVLVAYRRTYRERVLPQTFPLLAIGVGIAVGVAWLATEPQSSFASGPVSEWLAKLPPALAVAWLIARCAGAILLVPIAEELAFRGYLYRAAISRDWHEISLTTQSLAALAISSLAFGLLHDRWLAGTLAGAAFALVMLRTGRLSDPIAAHIAANATIAAYAAATTNWDIM